MFVGSRLKKIERMFLKLPSLMHLFKISHVDFKFFLESLSFNVLNALLERRR